MRPPILTRHDDGKITVDRWQHRVTFSSEWLGFAGYGVGLIWFGPEPNLVTINVANGKAIYRLGAPDQYGCWPGELIEAEIDMPEAKADVMSS